MVFGFGHHTVVLAEYGRLGVFLVFSLILSSFILFLSLKLTINNPDTEKSSTYECGFEPYEDARNVFDVRFYIIAILFLIFDLEGVFFYPWCISAGMLDVNGFWFMIDFIIELLVGYIYAWQIGALDWN